MKAMYFFTRNQERSEKIGVRRLRVLPNRNLWND